jgi:hypothetical protein
VIASKPAGARLIAHRTIIVIISLQPHLAPISLSHSFAVGLREIVGSILEIDLFVEKFRSWNLRVRRVRSWKLVSNRQGSQHHGDLLLRRTTFSTTPNPSFLFNSASRSMDSLRFTISERISTCERDGSDFEYPTGFRWEEEGV